MDVRGLKNTRKSAYFVRLYDGNLSSFTWGNEMRSGQNGVQHGHHHTVYRHSVLCSWASEPLNHNVQLGYASDQNRVLLFIWFVSYCSISRWDAGLTISIVYDQPPISCKILFGQNCATLSSNLLLTLHLHGIIDIRYTRYMILMIWHDMEWSICLYAWCRLDDSDDGKTSKKQNIPVSSNSKNRGKGDEQVAVRWFVLGTNRFIDFLFLTYYFSLFWHVCNLGTILRLSRSSLTGINPQMKTPNPPPPQPQPNPDPQRRRGA